MKLTVSKIDIGLIGNSVIELLAVFDHDRIVCFFFFFSLGKRIIPRDCAELSRD